MRNRDAAHKLLTSAPHQVPAKARGDVVVSSNRNELIHLVELPHLSAQVLLACYGDGLDGKGTDKGTGVLVRVVWVANPISVPDNPAFQRGAQWRQTRTIPTNKPTSASCAMSS